MVQTCFYLVISLTCLHLVEFALLSLEIRFLSGSLLSISYLLDPSKNYKEDTEYAEIQVNSDHGSSHPEDDPKYETVKLDRGSEDIQETTKHRSSVSAKDDSDKPSSTKEDVIDNERYLKPKSQRKSPYNGEQNLYESISYDNNEASQNHDSLNMSDTSQNKSGDTDSTGANESGSSTLKQVTNEMKKVLDDDSGNSDSRQTDEAAHSGEEKNRKSSLSSSSTSSDSSDSETDSQRRGSTKDSQDLINTDDITTRPDQVTESSDQAGGHDPDNVAGDETPRPIRLSALGVKPGKVHEGKIRSLTEGKKDIDLTSIALSQAQVMELGRILTEKDEVGCIILRNSNIDDDGCQTVADALLDSPSQPELLNLNCNQISHRGVRYLLDILRDKPSLSMLLIHANPLSDEGVQVLAEGISELYKDFKSKSSPGEEQDSMVDIQEAAQTIVSRVISDAMKSDPLRTNNGIIDLPVTGFGLRELDIGDCQMTDKGAACIAELIALNTPIETLTLIACPGVTENGWEQISNALQHNTHLKTLSLDYCQLGDNGVELIAKGLENNQSITTLDLEANGITERGAEKLLGLVHVNSVIKDITLMPGNKISDETIDDIKRGMSQDQTVLY